MSLASRRQGILASLERPRPLPNEVPRGTDARDLRYFDSWIDHPGQALTPQLLLQVYRLAENGYPQRQCDLFDDMVEVDAHLRSLFEQRQQAVAGKPWVIQSGGASARAKAAAHVLATALRQLPMLETFEHLLTFNRYGYGAAEIDWGVRVVDGRSWIVPTCFTSVRARRFTVGTIGMPGVVRLDELRLLTDLTRPHGDELRAGKWIIVHRNGPTRPRAGLMRTGGIVAMGKRLAFRDWLILCEKYGLPLSLAKYDRTGDPNDIDIAHEIIRRLGDDGGAVVPKDIEIEIKEAARGESSHMPQGSMIAFCNAENSKLVIGGTLTNDNAGSGGASYALANVHQEVRWDNVVYDAERLQEAVRTQVAVPFMHFNAVDAEAPLLKIQVVRNLDPVTRMKLAVQYRNELGGKVSRSQMDQEIGFYEPIGPDDELPGMQVDSFPVGAGGKP